jgi:membrane fusion protein (multidrug efflux system)
MKKTPMTHTPRFIRVAGALLWLAWSGCQRKTAAPPGPPEVLVLAAATKDVPVYREWVGTLDGSENAEIRARVVGYLLKRNYQEGTPVKKGDLLFEIDPRPFEAALAEAKSQLEQGRATQLGTEAELARAAKLFEQKIVPEQEFTNKKRLNESNVAKVQALQAVVDQADLNLKFCQIVSPLDGLAGNSQAQVGDLVGQGTNAVLTSVSTLEPIKLLFPISEQEYLRAAEKIQDSISKPLDQRDESIELILGDGSAFPHKGRLLSIDRQVNQATGTILVTALAKNPGGLLRPGQFARARIMTRQLQGAVVVPQRAVYELQGMHQLGVIGPDRKAEIRAVQVGVRVGTEWIIESGLKPGEQVVVEGFQKLRAGGLVVPKPWTPPAPPAEPKPANP